MNGVINVYKEAGFTSHDVVAKLRGILKIKKVGHTGTLDPDAVGVLPVCLGKATKLCDMITDWSKTYEAVMLLGTKTDTQDTSGKVLEVKDVNVSEVDICEACNSFVGEYEQIPPMYSALKVGGKKLYELARQGIEVERKARKVSINSIRINEINLQDDEKTVTMTIDCSKGTYIRTLCEDIGEYLGCGACMKKLTRTRVGKFSLDDTLTLNQIAALMLKGEFEESITPIDSLFIDYEKKCSLEEFDKNLYNGNIITRSMLCETEDELQNNEPQNEELFRIYDSKDTFVGIYSYNEGVYELRKMFYER